MFAVARRDTGYKNSPQSLRTGAVGLAGQKDGLIFGFVGGKQLGIDKKRGQKITLPSDDESVTTTGCGGQI